ncbi:MAG: hypothetical protein ABJB10_23115 [Mesorhizobium sp.]
MSASNAAGTRHVYLNLDAMRGVASISVVSGDGRGSSLGGNPFAELEL